MMLRSSGAIRSIAQPLGVRGDLLVELVAVRVDPLGQLAGERLRVGASARRAAVPVTSRW